MFIYETPPVDFFDGLMKLADYIKKEDDESNTGLSIPGLIKFAMFCAREVATSKGNTTH